MSIVCTISFKSKGGLKKGTLVRGRDYDKDTKYLRVHLTVSILWNSHITYLNMSIVSDVLLVTEITSSFHPRQRPQALQLQKGPCRTE